MIIVGPDWSRCKHDFVIMDLQGKIIERGAIAHNANALEELAARIECQVNSGQEIDVGHIAVKDEELERLREQARIEWNGTLSGVVKVLVRVDLAAVMREGKPHMSSCT